MTSSSCRKSSHRAHVSNTLSAANPTPRRKGPPEGWAAARVPDQPPRPSPLRRLRSQRHHRTSRPARSRFAATASSVPGSDIAESPARIPTSRRAGGPTETRCRKMQAEAQTCSRASVRRRDAVVLPHLDALPALLTLRDAEAHPPNICMSGKRAYAKKPPTT